MSRHYKLIIKSKISLYYLKINDLKINDVMEKFSEYIIKPDSIKKLKSTKFF